MTSPQPVSRESDAEYDFDRRQDDSTANEPDIGPARGIALGILLSAAFWIFVWWLFR